MVDFDVRHVESMSFVAGVGGDPQLDLSGNFIRSFMRATLDYGGKGYESRTRPNTRTKHSALLFCGCCALIVFVLRNECCVAQRRPNAQSARVPAAVAHSEERTHEDLRGHSQSGQYAIAKPPHRSTIFSEPSESKIQIVFLLSSLAAVVFEFETRREPSVPFRMLLQVDGTQAFYVTECCERRWVVTSDGEDGSTSQRLGPVRTLSVQSTRASNVS